MTAAACACTRPIRDSAFLCRECTSSLEKHLAELPALAADLDTTRTRTSRIGGRGLGIVVRSSDRPVPWNDRASRLATELATTLDRWARRAVEIRQRPDGPVCRRCLHPSCVTLRSYRPPAGRTVSVLSTYLLGALPTLRHLPDVIELADAIDSLTRRGAEVVDRPADQTYFGPCGAMDYWPDGDPILCTARCPSDLYGPEDAKQLTCTTCGAEHDVTAVRAYLLSEAQDQLVTAADLSKFLSAYGEPLTAERIRQWASRGLLVPHGKDRGGRPLYRVSEAVDRLTQIQATRRRTQSA
jgi:hypothetical protein